MTSYTVSVFITGGIYAIVALGLHVTLLTGQFSVAHAALMGLGGYAAGYASVEWGLDLFSAALFGGVIGLLCGGLMAAVLRRMEGMLLGIATLAIGQAASLLMNNVDPLGGALGYMGVPLRTTLAQVCIVLALVLLVLTYLRWTRLGLALLSAGKDEVVAEAVGISTRRMRIVGFALGGALAGIGGGLMVQFIGLVRPSDLAFAAEIQLFTFVIIGGMSTPWGAVAGAVGITWGLEWLRFATDDRYWLLGLALLIVVLVRPDGLLRRRSLRFRDIGRAAAPLAETPTATPGRATAS